MFNLISTAGIKPDKVLRVNNRAKLDTGTHCNYKCGFCYYKSKLDVVTPAEEIYKRIDYLDECGITSIDLSGGESSIHSEWFNILDYCKSKSMSISTLTNGYKFAKNEFMKESKEHGLEEILFSLHGSNEDIHDKLVGRKHGFKNILRAIKNAHDNDILVRINCTVTMENHHLVDNEFVNLIKDVKPSQLNFLTLNYWDDAGENATIDYKKITDSIKSAITKLKNDVDHINVRYTPYCFMKGFEEYVCNYYQHIYDLRDWNIALYEMKIDPSEYKQDPLKAQIDAAKVNRDRSYYKNKECIDCKYYFICDGVENKLTEVKMSPEVGDRIKEINHFRPNQWEYGS